MAGQRGARPRRVGRQRVPAPLLKYRVPSGAGSMLQPNVTGDGDTPLTPTFWVLVALTGVAAGALGSALMGLLFLVQHLGFGVSEVGSGFQAAVEQSSGWNRVVPLLIGGVIAGPGWYLLRKLTPGRSAEVDAVLWTGQGRLSTRRSLGTSVLSEIIVGLGASLGREAAPKLMGAVAANLLAEWRGLSGPQRRLLMGCGGGAGLAAVYNVPLGGALFAAEVLLGSTALPVVLPALACAGIATGVAWLYLPNHATYPDLPAFTYDNRLLVWALLFGVLAGVLSVAYVRLIGWVSHHRVSGRLLLIGPLVAFAILALISLKYPQLYGNGKGIAEQAFLGVGGLGLLLALGVLKPLVTAMCLGSGASGGLFTPVLCTGAALGAGLGIAWSHLWPGSPVGAYAMIGAAALIGAAMQAPLAALALVLELTHDGFAIMVPMVLATVLATAISRWIDGYSIYSARLTSASPLES